MNQTNTVNWPPFEEALAVIHDRDRGYIRLDADHSAASESKLRMLYEVVKSGIEDGTYGRSQAENDPVAQRMAFLEANPGTAALAGLAAGGGDRVGLADVRAENAALKAQLNELAARVAGLAPKPAAEKPVEAQAKG